MCLFAICILSITKISVILRINFGNSLDIEEKAISLVSQRCEDHALDNYMSYKRMAGDFRTSERCFYDLVPSAECRECKNRTRYFLKVPSEESFVNLMMTL